MIMNRALFRMMWRWLGTVILAGGMASVVQGAPVLGVDDFETGTSGWNGIGPDGEYVFSRPLSGGNGGGYLQLYFPESATPAEQIGYLYNNDANHTGNYTDLKATFDFYVAPVSSPAVALNLYFVSGATTWYYDFTLSANQWTPLTISFAGAGWYGGSDFLTDLQTVSEIGIEVHHFNANGSSYTYGLDNWAIQNLANPENPATQAPEPETCLLVAVVLMSLGFTFRDYLGARLRGFGARWRA